MSLFYPIFGSLLTLSANYITAQWPIARASLGYYEGKCIIMYMFISLLILVKGTKYCYLILITALPTNIFTILVFLFFLLWTNTLQFILRLKLWMSTTTTLLFSTLSITELHAVSLCVIF